MHNDPVQDALDVPLWRTPPYETADLDVWVVFKDVFGQVAADKTRYTCYECFHIYVSTGNNHYDVPA
jgi:hypothetical protein